MNMFCCFRCCGVETNIGRGGGIMPGAMLAICCC